MAIAVREATDEEFLRGEIVAEATLDELKIAMNREHGVAQSQGMSALHHAIACGGALTAARVLIPDGEFMAWCQENFQGSLNSVFKYMRLHERRVEILENPDVRGIVTAVEAITTHRDKSRQVRPRASGKVYRSNLSGDEIASAKELRLQGMKLRDVASALGVSAPAICRALNPDAARRHRETNARRRQIARLGAALMDKTESNAAARAAGVSGQWAALHRLGEQMAQVAENGTTPEIRQAFASALKDIYRARDKVSAVLGQV